MSPKTSEHLLFEIGTEEIPSEYLEGAADSIRRKAPILLEECGYHFDNLEVHYTPRRLVVFARNFLKQKAVVEERFGPSKEQSYQGGNPTPALLGFLKSMGMSESGVQWKETPKGVRATVFVKKETKPLKHFFETLPLQIEFPKLMRWERMGYKFTRPIRWTFALAGSRAERYRIGDVESDRYTYGHRFLANHKIKVVKADLAAYQKLLKTHHVILSSDERISKVRQYLKASRNSDEALIRQVANLVEEPFAIAGTFKKDYLALPSEVLSTCMRKHQKIFACYDSRGKLQNQFVAVINGKRASAGVIADNFRNVLESRLEDAKFFYQEDMKTTLESKTEKLKELIFLGKLGSYWDKTKRLESLCGFLTQAIQDRSANQKIAIEAARLCKTDLVTKLVYEFPELQGIAGGEYARHDGCAEETARAIREHYYPKSLNEDFRALGQSMSVSGAVLAIADRMDLLVGAIGIGIEPTGSQDPYALRRAAGGVVKLVRAFNFSFLLSQFIEQTAGLYGARLNVKLDQIQAKLLSFMKERVVFELDAKPGTKPYEILQAVLQVGADHIADAYQRFHALTILYERNREDFLMACKIIERTSNILKGVKEPVDEKIDSSIFENQLENKLYALIHEKEAGIQSLAGEKKYGPLTQDFGKAFYQPVHDFFDQVMVNVPDQRVRKNRQALVKKINRLYTEKVADLSVVTNQ